MPLPWGENVEKREREARKKERETFIERMNASKRATTIASLIDAEETDSRTNERRDAACIEVGAHTHTYREKAAR